VCNSESDSENSDHGEEMSCESAYTPDMPGLDGKPKNGGPQRRSEEQVRAQRAASAQRASSQAESITQTVPQPLVHAEPITRAPTASRPLAPLGSDIDPTVPLKVPKKKKGPPKKQEA
jgi:hypothetical protein